jgi:hypothetical protein
MDGNRERRPLPARLTPGLAAALAASLLLATPALPQTAPKIKPGPCDNPQCRQFDFWIGDWDVFTADGERAGSNTVQKILGGCVVQENWEGTKGSKGQSYNVYSNGRWHQTWVDNQGTLLLLDGEFSQGKMVLQGDTPNPNGGTVRNRITWQTLPDGRVRQYWDMSTDEGQTWTDVFVGFYVRKSKVAGP